MAAPFLESVDYFCEDSETVYHHDIYKPTKHNFMCNRRSTWDVVKNGKDFSNVEPMTDEHSPKTIFRIVQPQSSARYVLVLDRSGSMKDNNRMARLKQSADKWIKYDLKLNSKLGITSFSSDSRGNSATEDKPLTALTEANKQSFLEAIDRLNPNGNSNMYT